MSLGTTRTTRLDVRGMTCANCAQTNGSALESIPGVVAAEVSYATDEAQVEYNPNDVGADALYDAIEDAGYEPIREGGAGGDSGATKRERRTRPGPPRYGSSAG